MNKNIDINLEKRLLQFSSIAALIFALLGICLGLWIGSLVIVFDGAYSMVSLLLTIVSLLAASYINCSVKKA